MMWNGRSSITAFLLASASAWAASPWDEPLVYDPKSAFLAPRYQASMATSEEELLTIAFALMLTRHEDDGKRLKDAVERRALKRLFGEPYRLAGTVEEAIRREAKEPEGIEVLRARALRAVTLAPVRSTGDEPGMVYLGNSVWYLPYSQGTQPEFYARVRARNPTSAPVHSFDLLVEEQASAAKTSLKLRCRPQEGDVPPKGAALIECRQTLDKRSGDPVLEALKSGRLSVPRGTIIAMSIGNMTIEADRVDFNGTHLQTADQQVRGAGCAALATCEQIEDRKAKAAAEAAAAEKARAEAFARREPSMDERLRQLGEADRQARQAKIDRWGGTVNAGIFAMLLLAGAAAFLTRPARPESTSIVASFFAVLTLLIWIVAVWLFRGITFGAETGWFMLGMIGITFLGPTLVVSVLVLAAWMFGLGQVTRFRVFALVLGILTPIFFWVGLSTIG